MFHSWLPRFNRWGSFLKRKTGEFLTTKQNMEQKFKVGDLVRCIEPTERPFNRFGTIVLNQNGVYFVDFGEGFNGHNLDNKIKTETGWTLLLNEIELAYPSDHDLLDFASRDSKIAELTAENEALKAELEKYKPKPKHMDVELYLQYDSFKNEIFVSNNEQKGFPILARKTVTITEGEGM